MKLSDLWNFSDPFCANDAPAAPRLPRLSVSTKIRNCLFTPRSSYTHHASLWGIPCYFKADGHDGCDLAGTNILFDLLVNRVVPPCFAVTNFINGLSFPGWQPEGWPIVIKGPIK